MKKKSIKMTMLVIPGFFIVSTGFALNDCRVSTMEEYFSSEQRTLDLIEQTKQGCQLSGVKIAGEGARC